MLKPPSVEGSSSSASSAGNGASSIKKSYAIPIILVPSALTSPITMANVKSFLVDGEYIPVDVTRTTGLSSSSSKGMLGSDADTLLMRRKGSQLCEFKVIDNVSKFADRPEYWDRVVAVFATGQPWQFKVQHAHFTDLLLLFILIQFNLIAIVRRIGSGASR